MATAAVRLGVPRHTLNDTFEESRDELGHPLDTCNVQLRVALVAEELVNSSGQLRQPSGA